MTVVTNETIAAYIGLGLGIAKKLIIIIIECVVFVSFTIIPSVYFILL